MGRPFKLNRHQQREAIARREAGEALTDIARTFGVHHTTIGRLRPNTARAGGSVPISLGPLLHTFRCTFQVQTLDDFATKYGADTFTLSRDPSRGPGRSRGRLKTWHGL